MKKDKKSIFKSKYYLVLSRCLVFIVGMKILWSFLFIYYYFNQVSSKALQKCI